MGPALVLVASLVCHGLDGLVPDAAFGMVYLTAVVATAGLAGAWPSALCALLAFLAWNFLFLPPRYTFSIEAAQDVLGVVVFGVVAVLLGGSTGLLGRNVRRAEQRLAVQRDLTALGRELNAQPDMAALRRVVEAAAAALTAGEARLVMAGEASSDAPGLAAARLALRHAAPAGMGSTLLPEDPWRFLPLRHGDAPPMAALGFQPGRLPDAATSAALEALVDQAGIAITRVQLSDATAAARAMAEAEGLRAILLSSLGHDMRTPLTAIRGAAETLRSAGEALSPAVRADLLVSIEEEASRLARWMSAILDLARMEAGQIRPRTERVDLAEALLQAAALAEQRHPDRMIWRDLPGSLPADGLDPALLDRVLENLLENALKYTAPGAAVRITARRAPEALVLAVEDDGPGIPPADLPHVFDAFFRAERAERLAEGSGLGLAICRGLVGAMGGSIAAESPLHAAGGTRITLRFPQ
jgi:two-component system sensor histidine kinase KdpD